MEGRPAWAFRIDSRNQIVGKAETADGNIHAVLWDDDVIRDLGTLRGGKNSFAQDINELGVVAGSSEAEIGSAPFTWTAESGFVASSHDSFVTGRTASPSRKTGVKLLRFRPVPNRILQ